MKTPIDPLWNSLIWRSVAHGGGAGPESLLSRKGLVSSFHTASVDSGHCLRSKWLGLRLSNSLSIRRDRSGGSGFGWQAEPKNVRSPFGAAVHSIRPDWNGAN